MAQALVNTAVSQIKTANAHEFEFVTLRMDKALALVGAVLNAQKQQSVKKSGKDAKVD